jgi:hypothetical protein
LKKFSRALCSAGLADAAPAGEDGVFSVFCFVGPEDGAVCARLWVAQIEKAMAQTVKATAQVVRFALENREVASDEALIFLVSMGILAQRNAIVEREASMRNIKRT